LYCTTKHLTLKEAANNLLARAFDEPQNRKKEKVDLPSFSIGVRLDPADRETLFNAMGERQ
jgi:hypothetical protein